MIKNGKFLQCTYCEKQALPNTEPPVCEEHNKLDKKAASQPKTLKELDVVPDDRVCITVRGNLDSSDAL